MRTSTPETVPTKWVEEYLRSPKNVLGILIAQQYTQEEYSFYSAEHSLAVEATVTENVPGRVCLEVFRFGASAYVMPTDVEGQEKAFKQAFFSHTLLEAEKIIHRLLTQGKMPYGYTNTTPLLVEEA